MSSSELSEQQEQQKNRCFVRLTFAEHLGIQMDARLSLTIAMRGM